MREPYVVFDIETNALESFDEKYRRDGWIKKPELPHTVHCLVTRHSADVNSALYHDRVWAETSDEMAGCPVSGGLYEGMDYLCEAARRGDILVGHNIVRFDIPALEHHFGAGLVFPGVRIVDTKEVSRAIFLATRLKNDIIFTRAQERKRRPGVPEYLWGSHELRAWGYRLGVEKGQAGSTDLSVEERFRQLTPEMVAYCRQDVKLNGHLYEHLRVTGAKPGWPAWPLEAMLNESLFSWIIGQQERNGVGFDEERCNQLVGEWLRERAEITERLRAQIPAWYVPDGRKLKVPKRTMVRTKGEVAPKHFYAGAAHMPVKLVSFNPGSAVHLADRLQTLYGWRPKDDAYTEDMGWIGGAIRPVPKTDHETLEDLIDIPVIPDIVRWLMLNKRIGQAAEGEKAWLNRVVDGDYGRRVIYGRQNSTGARTSRCSHHGPNLGQIPKIGKPFGAECRECFTPTRPGWYMVGADAEGLEMRMLANRLAYWDKGAFIQELLHGDTHTVTMLGVEYATREAAKEGRYADLYGCWDEKAGLIAIKHWRALRLTAANATARVDRGDGWTELTVGGKTSVVNTYCLDHPAPPLTAAPALGAAIRRKLGATIGHLDTLRAECKRAHKRGFVRLLDGRTVPVDKEHGVLNDLLQGDGMVVMKHATVRWWEEMTRAGLVMGRDYALMLQVHDEHDPEAKDEPTARAVGETFRAAIKWAGEKLGVVCPLEGSVKVGRTWRDVH